jgi:uncharacterized protein (DUF488 family)
MQNVPVFTIGFTQTTAKSFFDRLAAAGVRKVIDVRLHNTSQLAGFGKAEDLAFFLERLAGIEYTHEPLLAPTEPMLKAARTQKGSWPTYEKDFLALMSDRRIEERLNPPAFEGACLLCSEAKPHRCHRRLVCDYLNERWNGALVVRHL